MGHCDQWSHSSCWLLHPGTQVRTRNGGPCLGKRETWRLVHRDVLTSQWFMYNWPLLQSIFPMFVLPRIISVPSFTCFWFLPLVQKMFRRAFPIDQAPGLRRSWDSPGKSPNGVSVPLNRFALPNSHQAKFTFPELPSGLWACGNGP